MVRALTMLVLFFGLSRISVVADETFEILQVIHLPPVYYVGDLVEVRVRIRPPEGIIPAEPTELPDSEWIDFHSVRVVPISGDYDLRVGFTSFHPGTATLPSLQFGELVLENVKIHTTSIVREGNAELTPLRDQLLLPGTRVFAGLAVGLLLVIPLALILLVIWLRGFVISILDRQRERRPLRKLTQKIAELRSRDGRVDNREVYAILLHEFKRFLAARAQLDLESATSREMADVLEVAYPGIHESHDLAGLVLRFDNIKFGGLRVTAPLRERDFDRVLEFSKELEISLLGETEE